MTDYELKHLQRGDIVKSLFDSRTFVVTGNYGGHATAVATIDMTNPAEWGLVLKADYKHKHNHDLPRD